MHFWPLTRLFAIYIKVKETTGLNIIVRNLLLEFARSARMLPRVTFL